MMSRLHRKLAVSTIFRKICNLRSFAFYNFSQSLGFQPLEKELTTLQLLRILHGVIIISNFVRRTTARTIFRNFSVLQNFVFCNFCQNLGFQLLEKDLTTLQLLRILHGIIIISKFVRRTAARAIFRKFSILQNFAF